MLPRVSSFPNPAPTAPVISTTDTSEPMQLGLLRPSHTIEERQCRRINNLCLYCDEPGHYVRSCPAKLCKCLSISSDHAPALPNNSSHLAILLQLPGGNTQVTAIIYFGACSCFMDLSFATRHQIPLRSRVKGLSVHLADGLLLNQDWTRKKLSHCPPPFPVTIRNFCVWLSSHRPCFPLSLACPGYRPITHTSIGPQGRSTFIPLTNVNTVYRKLLVLPQPCYVWTLMQKPANLFQWYIIASWIYSIKKEQKLFPHTGPMTA